MSAAEATGGNAGWLLLAGKAREAWTSWPYLLCLGRTWSYGKLCEEVGRFAGLLRDAGVSPGARVMLVMGDRAETVVSFWGTLWAGMVVVCAAPMLSVPELRQIIGDCEPEVIVTEETFGKKVSTAAQGLPVRFWLCEEPAPWRYASKLYEPVNVSGEKLALLLYTSGTTGRMKGVAHTHANLWAAARGLGPQVLKLTPEDRVFSAARTFFAYGLGNSVYIPAALGAAAVVHPGPVLPGVVEEVFQHFRPTVFFGVPSLYEALSVSPTFPKGRLRLAVSAGEKLEEDLGRRLNRKLGVEVLDGLGMTETLHHITSNFPEEVAPGSAGRALAGFSLEVRGEAGQLLGEGEVGELWVKGPTLMAGYWGQPELTSQVLVDGWFRTGDLVSIRGGLVYTHGRLDQLIKIGGITVFPGEVEAVLRQHPAVAEAAVVPLRLGAGVVALKALVVAKEGEVCQEAELYRHCRRRLASYKVPRVYEVVGALPRTLTGKLQRGRLAAGLGE